MLHHEIFQSLSPERMHIGNIVLSPADEKPNVMSKPSNFSIDHILNSAGASIDKCSTVESKSPSEKNTQNAYVNGARDCYVMDGNVHQYPPILNWLQYSRYKPPRLPRKWNTNFSTFHFVEISLFLFTVYFKRQKYAFIKKQPEKCACWSKIDFELFFVIVFGFKDPYEMDRLNVHRDGFRAFHFHRIN